MAEGLIQTNEAKAKELSSGLKNSIADLNFSVKSTSYSKSTAIDELESTIKKLKATLKMFQEHSDVDADNLMKIHEAIEKKDQDLAGKGGQ